MRLFLVIILLSVSLQDPGSPCTGEEIPARCFALKVDSVYRNRGTDGKDLGANIPLLDAMERCVLSGGSDRASCVEYETLRIAAYEGINPPTNLRMVR